MIARFLATMVLLVAILSCHAANLTVVVDSTAQQTPTFLPSAVNGTKVISSPAWRDSATVIGLPTFIEGYEALTPGANVTLDWMKGRTKAITLNANTTFTFSNSPSGTTNIQTMIVQVVGNGTFTTAFTGASWQTVQVTTPPSGIITLYVFRARVSAIAGYAVDFTGGNSAYWAPVGGVLVPSPGQDYISFVSTAVTTGSNEIFNIDTDSAQVVGDTLFVVKNDSSIKFKVDAVSGYSGTGTKVFTDDGTFHSLSSATQDVFSGFYGGGLPVDVPTTSAALAFDLDFPNTMYQWDGSQWY